MVFVYDSQGDFVASILDDEANGSFRVEAYVDTNGQKIIALPLDGGFHVEMSATGDGTVSCQIEEYDLTTGESTRLVNYYDIPIREGDDLDIVVGRGDSGGADYTFTDADGGTVKPDVDVTGDQIDRHTLTVTAEGNGTVTGGGVFLEGEFAIVTAQPEEGAEFLGWFAGDRKVSSEPEYRFRVEEELELVGRFAGKSGTTEPDDPKPVTNPFTDVKEKDYFYQPVLWAVENGIYLRHERHQLRPRPDLYQRPGGHLPLPGTEITDIDDKPGKGYSFPGCFLSGPGAGYLYLCPEYNLPPGFGNGH